MTEPPDWVTGIPSSEGVHGPLPKTNQWESLSQDQLRQLRQQLLESILAWVVQALKGLFIPGGGFGSAFDQLEDWATDVLGPAFLEGNWTPLLESLFGTDSILTTILASVIPGLDASKIFTGTFDDSFIPGLLNRLLSSVFHIKVDDGTNLILGSNFDDPTLWVGIDGATSTVQKHSGTRSWAYTTVGTWSGPTFTHTESGPTSLVVKPGEKYYSEVWVFPKATNASAAGNGQLRFYATFHDTSGVLSDGGWQGPAPLTNTLTAGAWNKLSGNITVPAGYDRMFLDVAHVYGSGTPALDIPIGDVFYYDDVILREVTESQNIIAQIFGGSSILSTVLAAVIPGLDGSKITSGTISQSFVSGLTTIATNLASLLTNLFGGSSVLSQIIAAAVPSLDASKTTTGTFADAFVPGLGDRLLKTVFQGSTTAGSNLFISPGFEDSTIVRIPYGSPASSGYSTAQKHSGTQSWFWTSPAFWSGLILAPNETNDQFSVSTGDKFYIEVWVYPKATNTSTGGGLALGVALKDSAGVNSDQFISTTALISALPLSTWTKISLHTTAVPTGYNRAQFYLQQDPSVTSGNVYYVDDVIIREETQEQSILGSLFNSTSPLSAILTTIIPSLDASKTTTGTFSDAFVPGLLDRLLNTTFNSKTSSGSNLVLNPDFENTTLQMGGSTGSYSTDQKRTGSYSWKFVNTTAWEAVEFHNMDTNLYVYNYPQVGIKVQPNQRFYGEVYVRPHASNTKPNPYLNLQITISDSTGVNSPTIVVLNQTTTPLTAGVWTKMSGYGTIPTGYDRANLSWQVTDVSAVGDTYYLDNVLFREETQTQNIIENVVTKLFGGITNYNYTVTDAASALNNTNNQIAANASAIQALRTTSAGQQNSGVSVTINFADYANGSLPGAFTVGYSGSGTSTEGIVDGRVQWTIGNSSDRTATNVYNALQTLTDYQAVGTSWAYGPENYFGADQARGRIIARSNSAGTTFVYLDVFTSSFNWYYELGCVVSGSKTVMKSSTQFASGFGGVSQMYLVAGTVAGQRVFAVYNGNSLVYTHTEVGTTSQVGSGFRYTGFAGDLDGSRPSRPPTVNGFAFSDFLPPSTVGSGFRAYRNSTSTVAASLNDNLFGNSFFDTTQYLTSDLTYAAGTNNKLTVSIDGWYQVTLAFRPNTSSGSDVYQGTISRNGTLIQRGNAQTSGTGTQRVIAASFIVYCAANDYLQPGYWAASTNPFAGESTGAATYWEVALINRSLS